MAAMTESMWERTGRTLEEWVALVTASGIDPLDQKAMRHWLKTEHAVPLNTQWALADVAARATGWQRPSVEECIDPQYCGPKAALRPIFDLVRAILESLGEDVRFEGRTTYKPFVRGRQFAAVAPPFHGPAGVQTPGALQGPRGGDSQDLPDLSRSDHTRGGSSVPDRRRAERVSPNGRAREKGATMDSGDGSPAIGMPAAEVASDSALVADLLADQHPDLARLPLRAVDEGWDNAIFCVDDHLAVRLPRRAAAATLIAHEQRWLPRLEDRLTLPVPAPLRVGRPGRGYPSSWSVVPWLP